MTFCFKMRLPSAIVAHSYDRLRTTFLPRLDEALAHCANDAEMFFVCAHINVSLAARCLDCVCRKILLPIENILKISTANTCALPQPKFSTLESPMGDCSLRTWADKSRRRMMKGDWIADSRGRTLRTSVWSSDCLNLTSLPKRPNPGETTECTCSLERPHQRRPQTNRPDHPSSQDHPNAI